MVSKSFFLYVASFFYLALLSGDCHFSSDEMRLYTSEEWGRIQPGASRISKLLALYHATADYPGESKDYFLDPTDYFNRRVTALQKLITAIDAEPPNSDLATLKLQAQKKMQYLQEVPKQLEGEYILPYQSEETIARPLSLHTSYWCEFSDPLHRTGSPMKVRMDKWENSGIPSFFIFLETVEYDEGLARFAPDTKQVAYFSEIERAKHRANFDGGLCYLEGKPFDTDEFIKSHPFVAITIFVVGMDEEFYIHGHSRHRLHHSSEFAGGPVLAAGEIICKEGRIVELTNKSGHYLPDKESVLLSLRLLFEKLGSLEGIVLSMIQLDSRGSRTPYRVKYDAQEYYETGGEAWPLEATLGWTALHAVTWNHYPLSADIIMQQADIDAQDDKGNTALHLAAQEGNLHAAKLLIQSGAKVNLSNEKGETPLLLAIKRHHAHIARILLEQGADVGSGLFLLSAAAKWGNDRIFDLALDFCTECIDEKGQLTLMKYAVQNACGRVAKKALSLCKQTSLDLLDDTNGNSLLHYAAKRGSPETVKYLYKKGVPSTLYNSKGETPFHKAVKHGNTKVIDLFLKKAWVADINETTREGVSPLVLGGPKISVETLRAFLDNGADIYATDQQGQSVLHQLAYSNHKKARKKLALLLSRGAAYDTCDDGGLSPIHIAVREDNFLMTYWMLALTNQGNIPDARGVSLLDYAMETGNPMLIHYLETSLPNDEAKAL